MRFVFDENHPALLADMLRPIGAAEGYEVESVESLELRGTKDVELLHRVCANTAKGVLITTDRAMRRRHHERAAVAASGAVVVVGVSNWNQQSDLLHRARMMVWWWEQIREGAAGADPGSFLELPWANTPRALRRWRVKT